MTDGGYVATFQVPFDHKRVSRIDPASCAAILSRLDGHFSSDGPLWNVVDVKLQIVVNRHDHRSHS